MSAFPENALTRAEQYANERRGAFYTVTIWLFSFVAIVGGFAVWGSIWYDLGRDHEKRLQEAKVRPTTTCANLAQVCAEEQRRRWRIK